MGTKRSRRRSAGKPVRVCMQVLNAARKDVRAMHQAHTLAEAGYEVTILDVEHDPACPAQETIDGIHYKHVKMSQRMAKYYTPKRSKLLWAFFKLWRMLTGTLKTMRQSADVYHALDLTALPACYLAAKLHRKPLVFDSYEMPLVQPHLVRMRFVHRLANVALKVMMRRVTADIIVSGPLAEEMRRVYGGPQPVVLRNIPDYQPPIASNRIREYLGLPDSASIALYQGAFQENRSLHALVQAGQYLASGNLIVMMGWGPLEQQLAAQITELGVGDRVRIIPGVPHAELLQWTSSADLGLSVLDPNFSYSIKMCLPNKLFEYLMAGVPVLSSDLPCVVDVLQQYQAGAMVRDFEPHAIAHAINDLLGDRAARAAMRQNALAAARTDLNWEAEQRRLIGLYATLFGITVPQPSTMLAPLSSGR